MKVANIAEFKNNLSKFLALVECGEEIEICKRNIPIAHLIPLLTKEKKNNTKLGCSKGSVKIYKDVTEPMIPNYCYRKIKKSHSAYS